MTNLERQINSENPDEYNNLLKELYFCKCKDCQQTASIHRHQVIQKLSKIEKRYELKEHKV